ncbi:protein lsr2 precursor [Mycolicibacterium madagascariense]|uniref:Protein lsr2 n=1 Tax=Mycolicibacterium madagascariense TaxID=212765 RepID=A0A7I7XCH0_9MYCO|nr:Lsr2 family protein [Mycolicibacterium madagascariense]BBZ27142.1 protein lsr2 precursor [Mycolicibacterium madagascariense]
MKNGKTDDVDGTPADETVDFGIDGVRYEVDLSSANAAILRGVIAQWAERGRRVDRRRVRHLVPADPWRRYVSSGERVAIRQWCVDNGYQVGGRGPLPFHLVDAFRAANSSGAHVETRMLRTSEA